MSKELFQAVKGRALVWFETPALAQFGVGQSAAPEWAGWVGQVGPLSKLEDAIDMACLAAVGPVAQLAIQYPPFRFQVCLRL